MSLHVGPVVITAEGVLLAAALLVFLWTSHGALRDLRLRRAGLCLAWVSLCGAAGAALYGVPGTLAALDGASDVPLGGALAFGSFGGYWGVLLGAAAAARPLKTTALPLMAAFTPGILLGGAVARAAVFFEGPQLFPLTAFALWSACDMAAHLAVFGALVCGKPRGAGQGWPPGAGVTGFLLGYGLLRMALEFFRDEPPLWGPFTAGWFMSALQVTAGALTLHAALKHRESLKDRSPEPR